MKDIVAERVGLRNDPRRDARRLWLYFAGLLVTYGAALVLLWSQGAARNLGLLMIAPTVGALIAARWGPGVIQWGRPKWWLLAGLLPAVAALVAYLAGALLGLDAVHVGTLAAGQGAGHSPARDPCLDARCRGRRDRLARFPLAALAQASVVPPRVAHHMGGVVALPRASRLPRLVRLPRRAAGVHGGTRRYDPLRRRHHRSLKIAVAERRGPRHVERARAHELRSRH